MANKRKDSSRSSALRRMSSPSSSLPSTTTRWTSFQTDVSLVPPQSGRPTGALAMSSFRSIPDSATSAAAIALPASAPSTVVMTTAAGRYDARGAALYICAVVMLYAFLVVAFVVVLAVVNRRRRNRKSRDNEADDDDEYDTGVGRLSRYLASVSKLREIGERCGNGDGFDKRTTTAIASVCGSGRNSDDVYGIRSDWPWSRATSSGGRHVSLPPTDLDCSHNFYLQTAACSDGVGLDPYSAGNHLTAMSDGVPRAEVCLGARGLCGRHRRGGSMDLLTASSPTVGLMNRDPASNIVPAKTQRSYKADSEMLTAVSAVGRRPARQHRRHHGNRNGDWNSTLKQTSPADDVITLIQITPSDCSSSVQDSSIKTLGVSSPATRTEDHVQMSELTSSPMQMVPSQHCDDATAASRCRWSTGCNGDIWILQMVSDVDCADHQPLSPTHIDRHPVDTADQLESTGTSKIQLQTSQEWNAQSVYTRNTNTTSSGVPEYNAMKSDSPPISRDDSGTRRGAGISNRPKVVRMARQVDDEHDDVNLSDVIDMSVAHILNSCRGEQPSMTSATTTWNQLSSSLTSCTSDQPWYSAKLPINGTSNDQATMVPNCFLGISAGAGDNDGDCSSTSRDSNSSLQSPTELQRLIHVTSV